jgi:hypothetical protein
VPNAPTVGLGKMPDGAAVRPWLAVLVAEAVSARPAPAGEALQAVASSITTMTARNWLRVLTAIGELEPCARRFVTAAASEVSGSAGVAKLALELRASGWVVGRLISPPGSLASFARARGPGGFARLGQGTADQLEKGCCELCGT